MIYFLRDVTGGAIKIGTTIRLSVRLKQLTSGSAETIHLLAVLPGSFSKEKEIHERFAHLRRDGEWFAVHDDLLDFIATHGETWDGIDEYPIVTMHPPRVGGDVIAENLIRLGYSGWRVRTKEIAQRIGEKTGKKVSRQRIANILGSLRVYPDTVEMLAKGLGVKPEELTKRPKGDK